MLTVGVVQMDCRPGDVAANCEKIASFAGQAAAAGCKVVVYPEMSDTGYEPEAIKRSASSWKDAPFALLQRTAQEHGIYLICGISEKTPEGLYNCAAVVDPSGKLLTKYRKTHLFTPAPIAEQTIFLPGDTLVTAEIGGMMFGFSICYDLRFPELYRALALRGAHVLVNCTAWPVSRTVHWQTLARARAIENQAYFLGANRVGTDGESSFAGSSCIIDAFGESLALGDRESEELLIAELDSRPVEQIRRDIPVLQGRRCELYTASG